MELERLEQVQHLQHRKALGRRRCLVDRDVAIGALDRLAPARGLRREVGWGEEAVVGLAPAHHLAADVALDAALFLVDDRGQFLANRDAGQFDDYPDPTVTLGEAILAGTARPATGRVLVTHLGVGLADVIFGDAILRRAAEAGLGVILPR